MRLITFVVLLATAALCGCQSEGRAPATPTTTTGGQVAESPYHNVRPPEEYFGVLTPPLRIDLETTGIPRDYPRENLLVSEQDYLAALSKARAEGLDALSEDERLIVLFVTAAALAAQEQTIRYGLVAVDPVSGQEIGHLEAEEKYRFDTYGDYTLPNLSQRRTVAQMMVDDLGSRPHLAADAPDQVIESYDFTNAGTDDEKVTRTRCERTGHMWVRRETDYTEQYALDWPFHIFPNAPPTVGVEAQLHGVETIGGRTAYKVVSVEEYGPRKGSESPLWLDKETFWPLQWEFASGTDIIRGTVEEVNGEVDIRSVSGGASCRE